VVFVTFPGQVPDIKAGKPCPPRGFVKFREPPRSPGWKTVTREPGTRVWVNPAFRHDLGR